MIRCPIEVEVALHAAARRHLPPEAWRGPALARAIDERSARYTTARDSLHAPLFGAAAAADLAARALFFSVADAAKVMVPLAELSFGGALPASEPLRIADVGAGAGAMTLGALAFLHQHGRPGAVHVAAFDADGPALALGRDAITALAQPWQLPVTVTVEAGDVCGRDFGAGAFDLILCGGLLNELHPQQAHSLVRALLAALDPAGALVIVEPALRETARALHLLRDAILDDALAHVFSPCTRRVAPCPALADEDGWCHEDRPTALPERAAQRSHSTGLRTEGLKFSYLVLRHDARPLVAPPAPGRRALRVVSHPRKPKGKIECVGCGDDGHRPLRLLRRHRGEPNRSFERARRGDVVIVGAADEIGADDEVTLIRPAEESRKKRL